MIDLENTLIKIIDSYNDSPFGKYVGGLVKFVELLIKLFGMNTDHCAKEKKDAQLFEELKSLGCESTFWRGRNVGIIHGRDQQTLL